MTLRQLFVRLYVLIFGQAKQPEPITPPPLPLPPAPLKLPIAANDEDGEFYFRETILDQLDYYMTCIARMRRADPESFRWYSRLGGHIIPQTTLDIYLSHGRPNVLSPWFRETLPAFGAVFVGSVARDYEKAMKRKKILPRFFYFRKYDPQHAPPDVQRTSQGAVYIATAYWDDPEKSDYGKKGIPNEFPIVVTPTGEVILLRHRIQREQLIRHKKGHYRGRVSTIPHRQWVAADPVYEQWAQENDKHAPEFLVAMFINVANMYEIANSSIIRVGATKGDLTASFGVNIKRTPYFFKDREVNLTDSGRRKRIFHIVRPHIRSSGAAVRLHFRGERQFLWNGYDIRVTVPGIHHQILSEFNVGGMDVGPEDYKTDDLIGTTEIAKVWKKHIDDGKPLSFRKKQQ